MKPQNTATKPIVIAAITAFCLAVVKFIAGVFSGSILLLSSAIDSLLDLLVSALNFIAFKKSKQKPNEKFNFGFAKLEALAALFEGLLIVGVAGFIFYESVMKFGAENNEIDTDLSLYVMIFSLAVTGALSYYLSQNAKRTQSLILQADALHYKSDFYTNLAVIAALIVIKFTGFMIIDAIFGVLISGYIANQAISLMKNSVFALLDEALESEKIIQIKDMINAKSEISSFHSLMSRKSGQTCYLSVHLVFNAQILLIDAHSISNEIEDEIRRKFSEFAWEITIHLDPYDDES
ncbi:cation diffusion facilitator family transporter [Campylobacter suis]|uniref:Ferrous-iron efflux pump FieF n=1 Tax=Campylobacter suis TaxID=2790657 RepID=A0ABM8Q188_9BACT|nr:cation diffusion facilitator family transporter [Campylobacter suis]CAD7286527.1 Ferrous-iron efflux pump FieF [Campylobacter suis]